MFADARKTTGCFKVSREGMRMMNSTSNRGFTLVETMVALAIFSARPRLPPEVRARNCAAPGSIPAASTLFQLSSIRWTKAERC